MFNNRIFMDFMIRVSISIDVFILVTQFLPDYFSCYDVSLLNLKEEGRSFMRYFPQNIVHLVIYFYSNSNVA